MLSSTSGTVYLELTLPMAEWVLKLAASDLKHGYSRNATAVSNEDANALVMFLQHYLDEQRATVRTSSSVKLRAS